MVKPKKEVRVPDESTELFKDVCFRFTESGLTVHEIVQVSLAVAATFIVTSLRNNPALPRPLVAAKLAAEDFEEKIVTLYESGISL